MTKIFSVLKESENTLWSFAFRNIIELERDDNRKTRGFSKNPV